MNQRILLYLLILSILNVNFCSTDSNSTSSLNTKSQCKGDKDCLFLYEFKQNKCIHKVLFPMDSIEIAGLLVLFFLSIFATVAGIGGGTVFIPILLLMFNFSQQEATPISTTTVFLNLAIRNLISLKDRHLLRKKPLISFDFVLIFSPTVIMGTIFGVIINLTAPTWLILAFMIIFYILAGIKTFTRALDERKEKSSENHKVIKDLGKETENYLNQLKLKLKSLEENSYNEF